MMWSLILFQAFLMKATVSVSAKENTLSRSAYLVTRENKHLADHVVKQFESPSLIACSQSCLRKSWCTSTNFKKPAGLDDKATCELNKHEFDPIDDNSKLIDQPGTIFSVLLKGCLKSGCLNGGSCRFDKKEETFNCSCKLPWSGDKCEVKIEYETIGCYNDTKNRAIQFLEGKDPVLSGSPSSRKNPIAKCAVAARRARFRMFAIQNGGQCFASSTAPQTFDKYGKSTACKGDGEGGTWANQVYVIKGYETIGCYKDKDTPNRAIQTLERKDLVLDGSPGFRKNPIAKCAAAAMRAGFSMFAVQYGGHCFASSTALQTFDKYGKSTACKGDGEGGTWANQVYVIKGYETIGCFKDTPNRAIQTLERKDLVLDGNPRFRKNPIAKCAVAAMRAGFNMFAVQYGGQCYASSTAPQTFNKYGKSTACKGDGEGGTWANQVYVIKGQ